MGNRAWKGWVIVSILAAALWAGGPSRAAEEKAQEGNAQPSTFNSSVAFCVYAVREASLGMEFAVLPGPDRQDPFEAAREAPARPVVVRRAKFHG